MRENQKPVVFEELKGVTPDKIALGGFGDPGTGKSRFIATAPGTVAVIPMNRKTRKTIERVREEINPSKRILFPREDFIRHDNPMKVAMMQPAAAINYYRDHINRVKDAAWTLGQRDDVDTIAIDSGTQMYEDIMYAHHGRAQRIIKRDYGPPNQEFLDFINSFQHKHFIMTFEAKEAYKNDTPQGYDEPKGMKDVGYHLTVLVEHTRDLKTGQFRLSVRMCQDNASLFGDTGKNLLTDDMITFQMLALSIYPDSSPEDWE